MSSGTELSAAVFGQHVHLILILVIFFFWGHLKYNYNSNPQKEEELKENICREIANIPAEQLQKVNENFFRWCEECLHVEGQHFQNQL
jgi:uncharacterized membrane protein